MVGRKEVASHSAIRLFKTAFLAAIIVWIAFGLSCRNTKEAPTFDPGILPDVPDGVQALSLRGAPLKAPDPSPDSLQKLEKAAADLEADPDNPELLIWLGRRTAYTGDYREAIRIFSRGLETFPNDPRFYRHRGHRYISIREFDRAVRDLERAASLIEGREDEIEPDGMPNARNIPVSTLHTNIWYHLGLAYYLKNDPDNALRAYKCGLEAVTNDDMRVAFTHWLYMTLRRLNRQAESETVLEPIHRGMEIIENTAYYRLCLLYKGELTENQISGEEAAAVSNDAVDYGLANWHMYNGRRDDAKRIYEKILEGDAWASFGHIAAEADFPREFGEE